MADQEFLASFGVEMDETGLLRLQEAVKKTGRWRTGWPRLLTGPGRL